MNSKEKVERSQEVNDICGKYRKRGRPRTSKFVKKSSQKTKSSDKQDNVEVNENERPPPAKQLKRGRPKLSGLI